MWPYPADYVAFSIGVTTAVLYFGVGVRLKLVPRPRLPRRKRKAPVNAIADMVEWKQKRRLDERREWMLEWARLSPLDDRGKRDLERRARNSYATADAQGVFMRNEEYRRVMDEMQQIADRRREKRRAKTSKPVGQSKVRDDEWASEVRLVNGAGEEIVIRQGKTFS